ncbi:MAG: TatD family hydrolase [Puniceicoccales bacterium]|jgi:TatD DNase family protein|nr:TatD family hydrolase [Puniceicoccales bacterium]
MEIIDSHCHLDDFFNGGEITEVLDRAERASVGRMIAVGTHFDDWQFYEKFVKNRGNIFYTVGLHPLLAANASDIGKLPGFLESDTKPVAIGEIGLDYHRLSSEVGTRGGEIETQKNLFAEQLKFAKNCGLPVVIHSRQAFDDTLEILVNSGIPGEKIVFHCFDYGTREMERLVDFGAFTSFSGTLTYKKGLAGPLKIANPGKILVETDCPFLTPERHKPRRNEPAYIRATVERAAEILAMGESDFSALTCENTENFFALPRR